MIPNDPASEKAFLNACLMILRTVERVCEGRTENRDRFKDAIRELEGVVMIRRAEIEDQEVTKWTQRILAENEGRGAR